MKCGYIPARYVFAFVGLLGTFTQLVLKINLSVAIVDLIDFDQLQSNSTNFNYTNNETSQGFDGAPVCSRPGIVEPKTDPNKTNPGEEKFLWNPIQQGLVLSAYSYGVTPTMFIVANVARRFGPSRIVALFMATASILTILCPIVTVSGGYVGLVIMRVLIGITGVPVNILYGLVAAWSPPQERSKILSIVFAGLPLGVSVVMPVSGLLASSLGWKSVFYVTGGWGLLWSILCAFFIYDSPDVHPRISVKEKEFINSSLERNKKPSVSKIPWGMVFRSKPFLCLVVVHFCSLYGRQTIALMFPSYLKTVMKVDVRTSGILGAIPFMANGALHLVAGFIADKFIQKGFRVIYVRKALTGIGLMISAAAITGLSFSGCNIALVVAMGTFVIAMDAFSVPGFKSCMMELFPEFSGVTFSMSSTVASTTGLLSPQITGVLRERYGFLGWQIAFWIVGGLYTLGAIIFCVFGTNERQQCSDRQRQQSVVTMTETVE